MQQKSNIATSPAFKGPPPDQLRKQADAKPEAAPVIVKAPDHRVAAARLHGALWGAFIGAALCLFGILTFQAQTIREAGDVAGKSAVSGMLLNVQRDAGKQPR